MSMKIPTTAPSKYLGYTLQQGDVVCFSNYNTDTRAPAVEIGICLNFVEFQHIDIATGLFNMNAPNSVWAYIRPLESIGVISGGVGHYSGLKPEDVINVGQNLSVMGCNLLALLPYTFMKYVPVERVSGTSKVLSITDQRSGNQDVTGVSTHGVYVGSIEEAEGANKYRFLEVRPMNSKQVSLCNCANHK